MPGDQPQRAKRPRARAKAPVQAGKAAGKPGSGTAPAGLVARETAVRVLQAVLYRHRPLNDAFDALVAEAPGQSMEPRDRAFAHALAATVLRRLGQLDDLLGRFLTKPLPPEAALARLALLTGAAQLVFMGTPPHAAIDLAVGQCRRLRNAARFAGLVNAVLRRVAVEGPAIVAQQDAPRLAMPVWLWTRWLATYGEAGARAIAAASLEEAALDLSVKSDPAGWAARLGGIVLPSGSVRLRHKGRIEDLAGYAEGAWWVQDAVAALPVQLLGAVRGEAVADLCAAPGGKTAQFAAAGAHVTALDISRQRLAQLAANLARLGLTAELIQADATTWTPAGTFAAVLLDAPCLATGTIRRHPDVPHLKRPEDLSELAALQTRLLDRAVGLLGPGGRLVYCVCSLEPEEGPERVRAALARHPDLALAPLQPGEAGLAADWLTPDGMLRTLPSHLRHEAAGLSGMDGFFAARLVRRG